MDLGELYIVYTILCDEIDMYIVRVTGYLTRISRYSTIHSNKYVDYHFVCAAAIGAGENCSNLPRTRLIECFLKDYHRPQPWQPWVNPVVDEVWLLH